MMTQNELSDIIPNIEKALPFVDSVTIIDGGSKDGTIMYFRNWQKSEPKIRFYISPWEDDFPKQRNKYVAKVAEIAQPGDWLLTADPDEYFEQLTFEKLHNDAFEGDPNAPAVELAARAAELCGMRQGSDGDILGFKVSCDARLFAHEYPAMTVLTAGAGRLNLAHSDEEQIDLEELRRVVAFLVLFVLLQTGTLSLE